MAQISWEEEANFRLPVSVWQSMMELYYPNSVWVSMRKDLYQRIDDYKRRQALTSWEQALERLLEVNGSYQVQSA